MAPIISDILTRGLIRDPAFSAPVSAEDRQRKKRKSRNKNSSKVQEQILARCVSQVPACEAFLRDICDGSAECEAAVLPCCDHLKSCDFTSYFTCL